jgi:hypothetical protein
MASSFSNEPTMTLDKVQYTANAHTTGGRDGASRSAGVKQGDRGCSVRRSTSRMAAK